MTKPPRSGFRPSNLGWPPKAMQTAFAIVDFPVPLGPMIRLMRGPGAMVVWVKVRKFFISTRNRFPRRNPGKGWIGGCG